MCIRDRYNFITLGEYASQVGADLKNISADQVAVVYADGAIVDGEGFGKEIYGNTLAEMCIRDRGNASSSRRGCPIRSPR